MADIITNNSNFVTIEGADGLTAVANDHNLGRGLLFSIMIKPGGASDRLVMKDVDASGPTLMDVTVTATTEEQVVYFHGVRCSPFLDISACTLSAGAKIMVHHRGASPS